jgi:hypothetical protein
MDEQISIQTLSDVRPEEVQALDKAGDEKPFIIVQRQADNSLYVTMPDPLE